MAKGDILILTRLNGGRIYRYSGGAWDSGAISIPTSASAGAVQVGASVLHGMAFDTTTGDLLICALSREVRRYSKGIWSAEPDCGGQPTGIAVDVNGDLLIANWDRSLIQRFSGGSWQTQGITPPGAGRLTGLCIDPTTGTRK